MIPGSNSTSAPGVEQLAVVGAVPGTEITVSVGPLDRGDVVATGSVNELGSRLFRDLVEPAKYFLSTEPQQPWRIRLRPPRDPGDRGARPYPECGSLRGQPCRTAVLAAPAS